MGNKFQFTSYIYSKYVLEKLNVSFTNVCQHFIFTSIVWIVERHLVEKDRINFLKLYNSYAFWEHMLIIF